MNDLVLKQLLDGLKYITSESLPMCEHDDENVAVRSRKINRRAYELEKMLDYLFRSVD